MNVDIGEHPLELRSPDVALEDANRVAGLFEERQVLCRVAGSGGEKVHRLPPIALVFAGWGMPVSRPATRRIAPWRMGSAHGSPSRASISSHATDAAASDMPRVFSATPVTRASGLVNRPQARFRSITCSMLGVGKLSAPSIV